MQAAIARVGMPLDEFLEQASRERFELIDGERRPKVPTVSGHSELIRLLFVALYLWSVEHAVGEVFAETTFVLNDSLAGDWVKGARIPDVMVLDRAKLAAWKQATPDSVARPYAVVPDLVAEVVSPGDRYSEVGDKVQLYLRDGVRVVWVIDPQQRNVTVHTAGQPNPVVLRGEAVLSGGDVLPGFALPLADLFRTPVIDTKD